MSKVIEGVVPVTESEVRSSIRRVIDHAESIWDEWAWQVENKTWTVIGHSSWDEMRRAEYGSLTSITAPREERPELVARFRGAGLTQQQTADTLGVHRETVKRHDAPTYAPRESKGANVPLLNTETGEVSDDYEPDDFLPTCDYCGKRHDRSCTYCGKAHGVCECDREFCFMPAVDDDVPADDTTRQEVTPSDETGASVDDPEATAPSEPDELIPPASGRSVTGLDGKTYTKRETKPKRAPITDAFWKATYDLQKVTERLERLHQDDRFERNKNEVAAKNRNYLVQARERLDALLEELPN